MNYAIKGKEVGVGSSNLFSRAVGIGILAGFVGENRTLPRLEAEETMWRTSCVEES